MDSEENTFRKLRQVPFFELKQIIETMPLPTFQDLLSDNEKRDEFLQSHGWSYAEYVAELNRISRIV